MFLAKSVLSSKACISDGMGGCLSAYGFGSLYMWKGTMSFEIYLYI